MKKYDKIIFFNYYQNGDIHVSRSFVNLIIKIAKELNPNCLFEYVHKNPPNLLEDIKEIQTKSFSDSPVNKIPDDFPSFSLKNELYINTWYAVDNRKYLNDWKLTFDCLYFIFEDVLEKFFDAKIIDFISNPIDLFPIIHAENMSDIHILDARMNEYNGKRKILVCDGLATSGQASNIDLMGPTLKWLKNKQNHVLFSTNQFYSGIMNVSQITTKEKNLLQIGYLAKYFDIIIGRASGPSTFCITKQNLFERSDKQIISFISLSELFVSDKIWLGKYFADKIDYNGVWTADYESNITERLEKIK